MSKYILRFPEEIKSLKGYKHLPDAVSLLYDQWKKDPMDENNLVCLAMEAWYAILKLEYVAENPWIPIDNEFVRKKIYNILCEAMNFGLKNHADGILFNMYIGYAIKATPIHFVEFVSDWNETGLAMIRKAYLKDKEDILTKVFYYESIDHYSEEYTTASRDFWTTISISDWGDFSVQHHLFCMLDGDQYHRT